MANKVLLNYANKFSEFDKKTNARVQNSEIKAVFINEIATANGKSFKTITIKLADDREIQATLLKKRAQED